MKSLNKRTVTINKNWANEAWESIRNLIWSLPVDFLIDGDGGGCTRRRRHCYPSKSRRRVPQRNCFSWTPRSSIHGTLHQTLWPPEQPLWRLVCMLFNIIAMKFKTKGPSNVGRVFQVQHVALAFSPFQGRLTSLACVFHNLIPTECQTFVYSVNLFSRITCRIHQMTWTNGLNQ